MNRHQPAPSRSARALALWPLLLPLLATLAVYLQVGGFDFVNFDDDTYVYENPMVTGGLSPAAARWAFTTGHAQVWIPATWLSFQLDASLFGPGPAGFHRTNLLLHLAAAALAGLLARRLTGSAWAGAFVAALFGVHPVNVEAVAWVTARKDTLMAVFLLGAALAWLSLPGRHRLVAGCALAMLAMLAKPAAVMAPGLLLLLSWWLERTESGAEGTRGRMRRDLPALAALTVFAAAVSVVTVRLARGGDMGAPLPVAPGQRLADGVTGVLRYLERLAWPHDLAVRYPEAHLRAGVAATAAAALLVVVVTVAVARWRRRAPLAALGWAWFLACLLPSSGLVQGGQLPMGDRYVYIGALGLWTALAGALAAAVAARPRWRLPVLATGLAVVVALAVVASRQAGTWRSPEALWRHALAVTPDNDVAHQNLSVVLDRAGRPEEALTHLDASLAIRPRSETHFNAGNVNAALGRAQVAEAHYRSALKLNPALYEASLNLGSLLGMQGRLGEAREVLLAAAARQPNLAAIQFNLAVVAWKQGDGTEAAARCRRALELDPAHAGARELAGRLAGR